MAPKPCRCTAAAKRLTCLPLAIRASRFRPTEDESSSRRSLVRVKMLATRRVDLNLAMTIRERLKGCVHHRCVTCPRLKTATVFSHESRIDLLHRASAAISLSEGRRNIPPPRPSNVSDV